jgi:hypothetical protein
MMADTPLTSEMLLDQLRAANGMVIETNQGPMTYEYTAMLPLPRKISPLMFDALKTYLTRVATQKRQGVTMKIYKLRVAPSE